MDKHKHKIHVYLQICKAVYELLATGALSKTQQQKDLATIGNSECVNIPGHLRHATKPIWLTLAVDDFGLKYIGKEHKDHLIHAIKPEGYQITADCTCTLYYGITLDKDYEAKTP